VNSLPTVFILGDYLPLTDAGKSKGVLSVEEDEISENDDAHDETEMGENSSLEIHMVDPQEEAHISRLGEVGRMSTSLVIPVSEHSGILKSENIWACGYKWRVPIVVLSGCGTFIGKVKGEGVWNLPLFLMIATVPCIVVSQWKVEDTSTSELMKGVYKGLRSGEDVVVEY
jgi:hypothetical protein